MKLTKVQFEVLTSLVTDTDIHQYSMNIINETMETLTNAGLVRDKQITSLGLQSLEPYRVKRAIFLAAGFGSRMVPVTLETPKPLVKVNGSRIIDSLIDACLAADINEIYIVRGYLAGNFDELLEKYPMIKFLENPLYNSANNISSAFIARQLMENAYVFEADLVLSNAKIVKKYHYQSDVLGIWKESSDDWCLFTDELGNVREEKIGGTNCYQMVGIYYWNEEDGRKLCEHLEIAYNAPDGKQRYWETVPNQMFKGEYKIEVIPCSENDIIEIDTIDELRAIDETYC